MTWLRCMSICGGAATADMTGSQSVIGGTNAPQFNSLTPDTDLVTVDIGGHVWSPPA